MLTLKLAFRTLMRRKGRMVLIGSLVAFGTFLIVLGGTFASSAAVASRASIIDNFTGDFIVYSARSKELPSPFAFNTPLPLIRNSDSVAAALKALPDVETFAFYAQNFGLIQVERDGKQLDLPFIFYAVDPSPYRSVFSNVDMKEGTFFGSTAAGGAVAAGGAAAVAGSEAASGSELKQGVLISRFQNEQYRKNYGVTIKVGESIKVLGVTEGGANTERSELVGIFEPVRYSGVFNYINFMDAKTFATLYNFTGVSGLSDAFNAGLEAATVDEASLFDLGADDAFGKIDVSTLTAEAISGFTMAAVKLKDHARVDEVMAALEADASLGIKTARWDVASGFYAKISSALQAFIFLATALIFLVVTLIFMNTLIISVVERTAEIGTMRAIGADKSFVRGVFLTETLILNVSAALVAMAVSFLLLVLFGPGGVPLPESVSQFLIGGGPLAIRMTALPFAIALIVVVVVSVLATVYPVRVASSITPLAAMNER